MEIIGSDTLTYMIYDKEFLYIFDYLTLTIKNGSDQKHVNSRFFNEKMQTLKKIFFIKVPKTGITHPLPIISTLEINGSDRFVCKTCTFVPSRKFIAINKNCYVKNNNSKWK